MANKMQLEGWYHIYKNTPEEAGQRARELLNDIGVPEDAILELRCEPLMYTDSRSNPKAWEVKYVAVIDV